MTDVLENTVFIFLDDIRYPPSKHWIVCRSAAGAYTTIRTVDSDKLIVVSLDHDLGEDVPTGYDLLNWLEKDIATEKDYKPDIAFRIHSANPVGRANMDRAIQAIERRLL